MTIVLSDTLPALDCCVFRPCLETTTLLCSQSITFAWWVTQTRICFARQWPLATFPCIITRDFRKFFFFYSLLLFFVVKKKRKSYLMLRRYADATSCFSNILLFLSRAKQQTRAAQWEQHAKVRLRKSKSKSFFCSFFFFVPETRSNACIVGFELVHVCVSSFGWIGGRVASLQAFWPFGKIEKGLEDQNVVGFASQKEKKIFFLRFKGSSCCFWRVVCFCLPQVSEPSSAFAFRSW